MKVICPRAVEAAVEADVVGAAREVDGWALTAVGGCFVLSGRWTIQAKEGGSRKRGSVLSYRTVRVSFRRWVIRPGRRDGQGDGGKVDGLPPLAHSLEQPEPGRFAVPSCAEERERERQTEETYECLGCHCWMYALEVVVRRSASSRLLPNSALPSFRCIHSPLHILHTMYKIAYKKPSKA